jgi:predicted nucleic acid-binding protein
MQKDPVQGTMLDAWLHNRVLVEFAGRILSVDTDIALRCALLHVPKTQSYRDSLIAATALVHGMTVVTRNEKDFAPMGVRVVNPWG